MSDDRFLRVYGILNNVNKATFWFAWRA